MSLGNNGPGWLFCPADRPERFEKAAAAADVVILDLEDGVAAKDREAARHALIETRLDPARTVVRINPSATPDHQLDLDALARTDYTVVMLAKTESPRQIRDLAPREVIVLIETPLGAIEVGELARMENAFAVMWGAEDLFAVTGGTANRWPDGSYRDVAKHVRSQSLLAAKAFGKMALDSVYLNIKDLDGLRAESATTRSPSGSTPRSRFTRRRSRSSGRRTRRPTNRSTGRARCLTVAIAAWCLPVRGADGRHACLAAG